MVLKLYEIHDWYISDDAATLGTDEWWHACYFHRDVSCNFPCLLLFLKSLVISGRFVVSDFFCACWRNIETAVMTLYV